MHATTTPACMPTNTPAATLLANWLQCDVLLVAGAATGPPLALGLVLASLVVLAILDGCCQPAVFGDAATLPPQYTHAVVGGTASAGVVISFLRIITKAALPATPAGLRVSTAIYFALSAAICGGCVVVYGWLLARLEVVAYWRAKRAGSTAGERNIRMGGGWQDASESRGGMEPRQWGSPAARHSCMKVPRQSEQLTQGMFRLQELKHTLVMLLCTGRWWRQLGADPRPQLGGAWPAQQRQRGRREGGGRKPAPAPHTTTCAPGGPRRGAATAGGWGAAGQNRCPMKWPDPVLGSSSTHVLCGRLADLSMNHSDRARHGLV